jgi:NTP pyrophosphatase (non-canonical NTP hydrolase)
MAYCALCQTVLGAGDCAMCMKFVKDVVTEEVEQGDVEPILTNHVRLMNGELERLAMLAEECGETIQVIGKIIRHGYHSVHPNGGMNNRQLLRKELMDIFAVTFAMLNLEDIHEIENDEIIERWQSKAKWMRYQPEINFKEKRS